MTQNAEPSASAVLKYLMYGASLPERALRATSAVVSGAVRESATLLVPQAFRSSRSYTMFVQQMLDFLAHQVGGVERQATAAGPSESAADVEGFVARKTVGSFVELAGLATLHVSPLTVLAIVSDVAYGSREFLNELSSELKKQGIIDEQTTIDHAADLLAAISKASGETATAFDTPPLSVEGLKQTIEQTRAAVNEIDFRKALPQSELKRMWDELHEVAAKEQVSVMDVSTAVSMYAMQRVGTVGRGALSGMRVAGNMFDRHILQHYTQGLSEIRSKGFYGALAETSGPYINAVWQNFSSSRSTWTEEVLTGRAIRKAWTGVSGLWNRDQGGLWNRDQGSPAEQSGDHADQPDADQPDRNQAGANQPDEPVPDPHES